MNLFQINSSLGHLMFCNRLLSYFIKSFMFSLWVKPKVEGLKPTFTWKGGEGDALAPSL